MTTQILTETDQALDRLLTPTEAFRVLGLANSSGWAAASSGRIPRPIRIGRRTRWSARALERWIEEQHVEAQRSKD